MSARVAIRLALIVAGLACALQLLSGEYAATTLVLGPGHLPYGPTAEWLSYMLQSAIVFILFFLLLVFPTGRLLSSRWRIVAWVGVCGFSVGLPSSALVPGPFEKDSLFDNPFGLDAAILGPLNAVGLTLILAAILGAVLSLVVRLVRSRGEERQQIKWFVAAAVLGFFALFVVTFVSNILPEGNGIGALVGFLARQPLMDHRPCQPAHCGWHSYPSLPSLRHRSPNKPHPRLRYA